MKKGKTVISGAVEYFGRIIKSLTFFYIWIEDAKNPNINLNQMGSIVIHKYKKLLLKEKIRECIFTLESAFDLN